jgi:hypothetical protein
VINAQSIAADLSAFLQDAEFAHEGSVGAGPDDQISHVAEVGPLVFVNLWSGGVYTIEVRRST